MRGGGDSPLGFFFLLSVTPHVRCRLRLLKMERIKDYLILEEEFIENQERLKPREEKTEVRWDSSVGLLQSAADRSRLTQEERTKVEDLRGTPMSVGNLEEIIDDHHAIISSSSGPEYYVSILSFVDKDELEPGSTVLLHHKVSAASTGGIGGRNSNGSSSSTFGTNAQGSALPRTMPLLASCRMTPTRWSM